MKVDEVAQGPLPVAKIDDPVARSYLENRGTIETWANLRVQAANSLTDKVLELADVLKDDAQRLDLEAETLEDDTPQLMVRRAGWRTGEGLEPVVVALEWSREILDKNGEPTLFVGLGVNEASDDWTEERRSAIVSLGKQVQKKLGRPWQTQPPSGYWPLWRYTRPEGDALDEIELLTLTRSEFWRCWKETADEVDRIFRDER